MNATEKAQREMVVAEARKWLKTPYRDCGDIRGYGVDCGMLLVRVFVDTGLCEPFEPRPYSTTFFLHQNEEKYLGFIMDRGAEVFTEPQPGDVAIWRVGRLFAHAGIVTKWPLMIHAFKKVMRVTESDVSLQGLYNHPNRPRRIFSYWAKPR